LGCREEEEKAKGMPRSGSTLETFVNHNPSQRKSHCFPFFSTQSSSAPQSNGFTQMARMMDSLILDSLSTTPYAYTKITTHRPVKKATSTTHLPSSGMVTSSNAPTAARGSYHPNKKIPTQGEVRDSAGAGLPFTYFPQLARS
jgi:hypothetical protein